MIRAHEQSDDDKWACIVDYADYQLNLWVEQRGASDGYDWLYFGPREGAYALIYAVGIAEAHPTEEVRAMWRSRVSNEIIEYMRGMQCQTGDTRPNCTSVYTPGSGQLSATNGSTNITGSSTNFSSILISSDTLAFQRGGVVYGLPISNIGSQTAITLSAAFTGSTGVADCGSEFPGAWAKVTTGAPMVGAWRYRDDSDGACGYYSQVWHDAILIEAAARAYVAGLSSTTI
jgi:hypothetical protein